MRKWFGKWTPAEHDDGCDSGFLQALLEDPTADEAARAGEDGFHRFKVIESLFEKGSVVSRCT